MQVTTPVVVSRIGSRIIEWDKATLDRVLAQLGSERDQHNIEIETSIGEAAHNALMSDAEQIKHRTSNEINQRAPT
jgi:hypothetical protein